MHLNLERLESRNLLAGDIRVVHDPIDPALPGDEVTRTIRIFGNSFEGEVLVTSSLSEELENARWQREEGITTQERVNPYRRQEPDFQIAAGQTKIWYQSIDTIGGPLGDLNGDGAQDFLFFNAVSNPAREAVVVFGPIDSNLELDELAEDGSEGFKLDTAVRPLGDINGDGLDDIAHGNTIIFGAINLSDDTLSLTVEDAWNLESTGDINGDGFRDLLAVGVESYLIFGGERIGDRRTATADSLESDGHRVLVLDDAVSTASPAGDLNNDGLDDVVFGRRNARIGLLPFVLFGDTDFPRKTVDFEALNGTDGFAIGNPLNVPLSEYYGNWSRWPWRISGTSDVNGDSVDDLIIAYNGGGNCENSCTATDKDNIDVNAGVFVLHGGANVASTGEYRPEVDSHSTIRLATSYSTRLGRRLDAHVFDVNGDGLADIHVTAGAFDVSKNFVFFGDSDPLDFDLGHALYPFHGFNGEDGYQYTGDLRFFDVDGDGVDDALLEVLVHQPSRSDGGPDHRIDVFLGKPFEPAPVFHGQGDIDEIVDLNRDASIIYRVTGTLKANSNSATTLALPVDQVDEDLSNNLVSNRTGVSLGVHSTEPIIDGRDVELRITVTNDGPTNAIGVQLSESITNSWNSVSWEGATQLFPESISLSELPSGLGATLAAPEIIRIHEHCGCPTELLNQYLGRPVYEQLGSEAGSLGDLDGDGFDDIFLSDDASEHPTKLYWLFNGRGDFGVDGTFPAPTTTISKPEPIQTMIDINGDGFLDKLVASDRAREAHVLFGNVNNVFPDPSEIDGNNGFTIAGFTPSAYVSSIVSGDVNGDGLSDVIISEGKEQHDDSSPRIHVVFGRTNNGGTVFDVANLNGKNGFHIDPHVPSDNTQNVNAVSGFDINGDGIDDILVASPSTGTYIDNIGYRKSGEAYLIFGRSANTATGSSTLAETIDVLVDSKVVYTIRGVLPDDSMSIESGQIEVLASSNQIELSPNTNIIRFGNISPPSADINGDNQVNFADFLILSHNFGRVSVQHSDGDVNSDAVVDFTDFLILSQQFNRAS